MIRDIIINSQYSISAVLTLIVGELTSDNTLPLAIRGQSVIFLTWVRVGCKYSEKVWCQVWKSPEVAFWRHSKWCHHGKIMNSHVYHISRTTRHRDLADPSKSSQDTSFYSCFIQCMTFWSLEMVKYANFIFIGKNLTKNAGYSYLENQLS